MKQLIGVCLVGFVQLCSSEQQQQQIFLLNQQLLLLRETNRALRNQLEEGGPRSWKVRSEMSRTRLQL